MIGKMIKAIFFDAGPIISLVMSRLGWILPRLKEKYGGKFYITPAVKRELVERPLEIKRFEFEALQVMKFIHEGELESVTSALEIGAEAVVMDERTLRLLIEDGVKMQKLLEARFHREVAVDLAKIKEFSQVFNKLKIIRSIELVGVAYELGLLDSYVPDIKNGRNVLVDSVLWATKYNGCAVTEPEIEELKSYLKNYARN